MTGLTVRDAAEGDLPMIVEVLNEAILHTTAVWSDAPVSVETRAHWLHQKRLRSLPVLVAARDGRAVGYGALAGFRAWSGYARTVEDSLYVHRSARGAGVGKALLAALVKRAQQLGHHAMIAGIEAENAASIGLHHAQGFVEVGRLPQVGRKFDRWLDLVFMERMLDG